ncbi:MAG: hybrid sensor histidine kinase/response regulator [bacterium]|nr:hybrid sensor histidine kinase/response regulator [bacterium]
MDKTKSLILVVDDDPKNCQVLGSILKREKYKVAVAADGAQALGMLERIKPDLILLDVMMPGMSGFEVCKKIKENAATVDIPVIFLTIRSEVEDILKGFEQGAADYVTKPFNISELLARIQTHLELRRSKEVIIEQSLEQKTLLHILCHDLANPIRWTIGMLSSVRLLNDIGEIKKRIAELNKVVCHEAEIIKLGRDMFLPGQKFSIKLEMVPLSAAVRQSVKILARSFRDKNIKIFVHIAENIRVKAEEVSLVNIVLSNILSNAVKFSEIGSGINVSAKLHKENGIVSFLVKDNGRGMSKSTVSHLFDMTGSAVETGTAGEKGTGYGMYLVKEIVSLYGGTIEVTSLEKSQAIQNEESGTEVKITLQGQKS